MDNEKRSSPEMEQLIEIRDPEIDTTAVLATLQERLRERRAASDYEERQFPSFGGADVPRQRNDLKLDPDLYHYLDLVNKSYYDFETESDVQLSPATRSRFLGRIWSLIRQQAHQLVLFYVNRSIEHQVAVNRQLVSVVNLLTEALQNQQQEIMALRREIDERKDVGDGR